MAAARAPSGIRSSPNHAANVRNLERVWIFHTGDIPKKYGSELTSLKVGNAIYGCTPRTAVRAQRGDWREALDERPQSSARMGAIHCGVSRMAFYGNPKATPGQACAERIIRGTLDMRLIAVDAKSGEPCQDFGKNGRRRPQGRAGAEG